MPTPLLKKLSKENNVSMTKIEQLWDKAKKLAANKFSKNGSRFYPYAVGILKHMIGASYKTESNSQLNSISIQLYQFLTQHVNELSQVSIFNKQKLTCFKSLMISYRLFSTIEKSPELHIECGYYFAFRGFVKEILLSASDKNLPEIQKLELFYKSLYRMQSKILPSLRELIKNT